jgi:hypothetical protein
MHLKLRSTNLAVDSNGSVYEHVILLLDAEETNHLCQFYRAVWLPWLNFLMEHRSTIASRGPERVSPKNDILTAVLA